MINGDDLTSLAYLLDPCFQIVNTAGKPLTEGYIEVYYQGTRDKYYCSCDFDGTLLPFQIPLDSLGSNIVLASPDNSYDIYIYNKFGSLIMSRYNVKPGHGAGSTGGLTTITSSDNTVQIERTGNNYDLSIKDTIDRIDNLEDKINAIKEDSSYSVSNGYGDNGSFVLTDKDTKDITYLNDMSGWRLLPGHVYQLNFNSKFTLDDNYNNLVEGKLYLDGDMSFSQDWSFSLDDSFDHIKHINGSTIIVVPNTLQYYDLSLKYTFNSDVNCTVELENISIVDITSILKDYTIYSAGDGIDITNNIISVDMDYINEQINIDEKLSSAVNIANEYTDNSINTTINEIASATATLEQEIQNIPPQVQSDWTQDDSTQVDYIKNKPGEIELVAGQNIGIFEGISTLIIAASATDLSNCATHDEVYNSSVTAVNSANSYTDNAIANIDFSDYATHNEVYSATSSAIASANSYTDTAISNIDFSDYATHSEVYNSSVTAINSANSYTDTAIANLDLTPAVEIVSPNNTISVSSVVNSVNNTKTFYIDTNDPDTNYWIGEANLSLSDQSSQGQVGYYKDVFDYTTKLNGNLDATKLKKGLYLLTANVMVVADEVNNDLAEIQIVSTSTSAISYTSSVFQHDCSVADTIGEPMDESHQIATIVRVMYDDTPMSLIARMDDPTTVSNELHLWFSDICLYELQGTSVGGGSSPSASGSYDAGWGIVINGNVISVNPSIIPDVSNFATETYVNAKLTSAINIIESEIPDVSDMATRTWVNGQGYLTSIPSYYTTETDVNTAIATAINSIPEQVNADWNSTSGKSEILNKPETIDVDVCPIIAGSGISITASGNSAVLSCTVTGTSGENYSAGNGIDITNHIISIDNTVALKSEIPDVSSFITSTQASAIVGSVSATIENDIPDTSDMATKTWVGQQGYLTSVPSSYATDAEVSSAIATATNDMATKTWVGNQGYITEIPSQYVTETELSNELSDYALASSVPTVQINSSNQVTSINNLPLAGGGTTYSAGSGINITNDTISVDNTIATKTELESYIPYSASGVELPNSNFEIGVDGQAYKLGLESGTMPLEFGEVIPGFPNGALTDLETGVTYTLTIQGAPDNSMIMFVNRNTQSPYTDRPTITNNQCTFTWAYEDASVGILDYYGYINSTSTTLTYTKDTKERYVLETELSNYALASAIPSQVQSDWTEDDTTEPSYIQNKPETVDIDVCPIIAGNNITITASGNSAVIDAIGGSTYTAGSGIKIDNVNKVVSSDETVLWSGTGKISTFTLSEKLSNFERFRFVMGGYNTPQLGICEYYSPADGSNISYCYEHYVANTDNNPLQIWAGRFSTNDSLTYSLIDWKWMCMPGNSNAWTNTLNNNDRMPMIRQIIGINRIASN